MASKKSSNGNGSNETIDNAEVTTMKTKKKKKASSTQAKQNPNPQPAVVVSTTGDAPPTQRAPSPPEGWQPTPKKRRSTRGLTPKGAQITCATKVAKELGGSTTYVGDFGPKAPDAKGIADTLTNAAKWRAAWVTAKLWLAYTAEQRATWENEGMVQMAALEPAFDYSTTRDPAVAEKYRATAKFIGTTKAIGQRALASRRVTESEKRKAEKAAPPSPPAPNGSGTPAK